MTFSSMKISKSVGLRQSSNLDCSLHRSWYLSEIMSSGRVLLTEHQSPESRLYSQSSISDTTILGLGM